MASLDAPPPMRTPVRWIGCPAAVACPHARADDLRLGGQHELQAVLRLARGIEEQDVLRPRADVDGQDAAVGWCSGMAFNHGGECSRWPTLVLCPNRTERTVRPIPDTTSHDCDATISSEPAPSAVPGTGVEHGWITAGQE